MRLRGSAAPEIEFGLAAGLQGGQNAAAGTIPKKQLAASCVEVAGVKLAKERGASQPSPAEIEAEIDESVVSALSEWNVDEMLNCLAGSGNVRDEKLLGLCPGDAVGEGLAVAEFVAIADSGPAGGIVVSRSSESFGLLDEGESGIAQSHGLLQGAAGG